MTNKEIIRKLATKENFHEVVGICLKENLEIPKKCLPDINIYHHRDGNDLVWDRVRFGPEWSFKTKDGKEYSEINDFFIHYKDIIEFTKLDKVGKTIFKVIPNIVGKEMWSKDVEGDHYEISYDCHSYSKPALKVFKYNNGVEYLAESYYYVEGMLVTDKKQWQMLSRENKLSRVCGVDLKKEREEKEREEKVAKKKQKENQGWTTLEISNNNSYPYYSA